MAVLVSLDALFPTNHPTAERDGLVLTGWTAGVLHRWLRSVGSRRREARRCTVQ